MRIRQLAFASGLFSQAAQLLVFREVMAASRGNELLFGAVLAGCLLWTAMGAALAARMCRGTNWLLALACAAGPVLAAELALAGTFGAASVAGEPLSLIRAFILAFLAPLPAGALSGAFFSLVLQEAGSSPDAFAHAYRWESIGAIIGGLALMGLLAAAGRTFGAIRTAALAGMAPAAAVALRRPLAAGLSLALLAALAAGPFDTFLESARWNRALPGYSLRASVDSPYGRMAVLESPGGAQLTIFVNRAPIACVEPGSASDDSRFLADLVACIPPQPRRACVVGGTIGAFPARLAEHGIEAVDAVELDPSLHELVGSIGIPQAAQVRRIVEDGRRFLRRSPPGHYDIVVVFPGEPDSSISSRFCSVEFFRDVSGALSRDGTLVLFLPTYGAALEYHGQALARRTGAVFAAMREVFGDVRAAPVAGHMLVGRNSGGRVELSPRSLGRHLTLRPRVPKEIATMLGGDLLRSDIYFGALFGGALAESALPSEGEARQELVARLERRLAEQPVPASRDDRSNVVLESLAVGGELRSGAWLVGTIASMGPYTVGLPAALVAALWAWSWWRRRSGRTVRLLIAFATGMFGMAVETAMLWSYQTARGCVYSELGGLTASFMAGLALGATLGGLFKKGTELGALLAIMVAMAGIAGFIGPILRGCSVFAPLYWLLAVVAGALDGATFPLLVRGGRPEVSGCDSCDASSIYASDLAGSAAGAAFAGTAWIPTLGLAGAGAAAAAAVAVAAFAGVALKIRCLHPESGRG